MNEWGIDALDWASILMVSLPAAVFIPFLLFFPLGLKS